MARDNFREKGAESPHHITLRYKTQYVQALANIGGKEKEITTVDGGLYHAYDYRRKDEADYKGSSVNLPIQFIILDESTVRFTGYDEPAKQFIRSNIVSGKDALITVQQGDEITCTFTLNQYQGNAEGTKDYTLSEQTKAMVKSKNAKYTSCVFALMNIDGEWEIVMIEISGSALTGGDYDPTKKKEKNAVEYGWFAFLKKNRNNIYKHWIIVENTVEREKSSTTFTIPVYELGDALTQSEQNIADTAMAKLRPYLNSISGTKEVVPTVTNDAPAPYVASMGNVHADQVLDGVAIPVIPEEFGAVNVADLPPDDFYSDDLPF